mmetsp:Transcript_5236/g.4827  ORF Transcript_5236/g.4827 Transcript_5236/m.4827 type:complete len:109 (+) Transcript_5236:333-659(+)
MDPLLLGPYVIELFPPQLFQSLRPPRALHVETRLLRRSQDQHRIIEFSLLVFNWALNFVFLAIQFGKLKQKFLFHSFLLHFCVLLFLFEPFFVKLLLVGFEGGLIFSI